MHSDGITSGEYIRSVLDLPEDIRVESIISFVYPDEEKPHVPNELLDYHKVISKG